LPAKTAIDLGSETERRISSTHCKRAETRQKVALKTIEVTKTARGRGKRVINGEMTRKAESSAEVTQAAEGASSGPSRLGQHPTRTSCWLTLFLLVKYLCFKGH
jgi:hypothetical protein